MFVLCWYRSIACGQWRADRRVLSRGRAVLLSPAMSDAQPTMADMDRALHIMLDENESQRAELARVRGRLDALMTAFDENGTLGILQMMAHDQNLPPEVRIRAAGLAVPFERPKLSVTATTSAPLFDLLEAKRRKGKVIEHAPAPGDDPGSPAA